MPFQFKLAKRLALAHIAFIAAITGCSGENGIAGIGGSSRLLVFPGTLTIDSAQSVQFQAYASSAPGDSVAVPVSWQTTGGEITPTGRFTPRSSGRYAITAVDMNGHRADASVTVIQGIPPSDNQPFVAAGAECSAPRAEWIWCDDFEQDRLARYFEYDQAAGNFTRASSTGRNGSVGMRAHWSTGAQGAGSLHLAFGKTPGANFRPVDGGTSKYREIYWRMYVKNQAGWVGGGGDKLSRAFVFAGGNYSQAAIGHVWSGGTPGARDYLVIDPASGTDAAGNLATTGYNDFAHLSWLGSVQGTTPLFDGAHAGAWHCVEAHMQLNKAGSSDGTMEVWADGSLQARHSGLNFVGAYSEYGINAVYFENYWNAGSAATQDRVFDNIVVSTARIGC